MSGSKATAFLTYNPTTGIVLGPGYSVDGTLMPSGSIACTADQAQNWQSWIVVNGVLTPYTPVPPVLTVTQQAGAALSAGLTIVSAGTPAMSGLYAIDATAQSHLQAETIAILLNGTFADGSAALAWPDMAGTIHTFTSIAEFKAFASAIAAYVAALYKVLNGSSTALPPTTATIA